MCVCECIYVYMRVACVYVQIKVFQLTRWYLCPILRLLNIDTKRAKIEEWRIDTASAMGNIPTLRSILS